MPNYNINTNVGRVLLRANTNNVTITNDKITPDSIIIASPLLSLSLSESTLSKRYWRIINITFNNSSSLEITELQLHSSSGNENPNASKSCSVNSSNGTPYRLWDNLLTTQEYWNNIIDGKIGSTELIFKWDFATPKEIIGIKIGGYDNSNRYPSNFVVECSDDNSNWTTVTSITGLTYPGNFTLSSLIPLPSSPSEPQISINSVVAVAENGFCTLYSDVTPTSNTKINFLIIN